MEYFISACHWLDALTSPVDPHIEKLVPAIQKLLDPTPGISPPVGALPSDLPSSALPAAPPNNLPTQLTSFIGRERERQEVETLLGQSKLLTLSGIGGTGKTRLALQVAEEALTSYPEGVWLVELAAVQEPDLVPQEVALVLKVREEAGSTLTEMLCEALKPKRMLLLLDNCEHLLRACSRLAYALLKACPNLRILATSREALNLAGETVFRVPILGVPAPAQFENPRTPATTLQAYEAVRLFADRARHVQPAFALNAANTVTVARLVHQLDGIPLAIELAAARVRAMTVEKLAERLDERFKILASANQSVPTRQQTLRALLDWSFDLLSEPEAALFARLSVFAGGWTMEACEQVCATPDGSAGVRIEGWEILDLLMALTDKSLVVYDEREGEGRYHFLESVRQYSRDKRAADPEGDLYAVQHRNAYLALAEEAAARLQGVGQVEALNLLEREHDNLRVALTYALEHREDLHDAALRLCVALGSFWEIRGHFAEGRERLAQVLEAMEGQAPHTLLAAALDRAGMLAWNQGDFGVARRYFERSLALARQLQDRPALASEAAHLGDVAYAWHLYEAARAFQERALAIRLGLPGKPEIVVSYTNLGNLALQEGDLNTARSYYEQGLVEARRAGSQRDIALLLSNLGIVATGREDYALAGSLFEESLALKRALGDRRGIAQTLENLAILQHDQGHLQAAAPLYIEALELAEALGDRFNVAILLEGIASLWADEEQWEQAVRLYAATEALHTALGVPIPAPILEKREGFLSMAKTVLATRAYEVAWREGVELSFSQAVAYALVTAAR